MTGNRGGYPGTNFFHIESLFFAGELFEQLVKHVFNLRGFQPGRRDSDGNAATAKWLRFESIGIEFFGNSREYGLLCWREFKQKWHEQALTLGPEGSALLQDFFEQDALVSHMLIDDPKTLVVHSQNE